jgi:hypothetical protein
MCLQKLYIQAGLENEVMNMRGDANTLTIFAPTGEKTLTGAILPQLVSCNKDRLNGNRLARECPEPGLL